MPSSWAASSKRREQAVEQGHDLGRRHLRRQRGEADQVGERHRDLGEAVGDALLAAAQPVGDRRRQHVEQQLLVLAVLVLDDDVLGADLVDHAVEGEAELADLVARAHRHLGVVVAGGEAADAGGQLGQRPEQRTRQPRADHEHHQQGESADHHADPAAAARPARRLPPCPSWRPAPI